MDNPFRDQMPFGECIKNSRTIYGDYYDSKLLGTANPTDHDKSSKMTQRPPIILKERASTSTANYNDPVAGLGLET